VGGTAPTDMQNVTSITLYLDDKHELNEQMEEDDGEEEEDNE